MIKKPYLIAEIGINHNGDLKIAKKLIKNAKDTGFDAVLDANTFASGFLDLFASANFKALLLKKVIIK